MHKKEAPKELEDETLECRDCGGEFIFSAGQQEFFKEKGFDNKPTRCKECQQAKKARFDEGGGGGGGRGGGRGGYGGGGRGGRDGGRGGRGGRDGGRGGGGGGACYAFQKGDCNRGDSCRFTH